MILRKQMPFNNLTKQSYTSESPFWRLYDACIYRIDTLAQKESVLSRYQFHPKLVATLLQTNYDNVQHIIFIGKIVREIDKTKDEWIALRSQIDFYILKCILCMWADKSWNNHLEQQKSIRYWNNISVFPYYYVFLQPWNTLEYIKSYDHIDYLKKYDNDILTRIGALSRLFMKGHSLNNITELLQYVQTVKRDVHSWKIGQSKMYHIIDTYSRLEIDFNPLTPPSFFEQYGLGIGLSFLGIVLCGSKIVNYLNETRISDDIYKIPSSMYFFLEEHLFDPVQEIWKNIILGKDNQVVTAVEVQETKNKLRKLLEMYMKKYRHDLSDSEKEKVSRNLNISVVQDDFVRHSDSFVWSFLFENMDMISIIQIEDVKLELMTTIVKIDQLLNANKLSLEIAAIIPLVGIFWVSRKLLTYAYVYLVTKDTPSEWIDSMKITLRDLDRLVTLHHVRPMDDYMIGELVIFVDRLHKSFASRYDLFSAEDKIRWTQDIDDLLNLKSKPEQRYRVIERINRLFLPDH